MQAVLISNKESMSSRFHSCSMNITVIYDSTLLGILTYRKHVRMTEWRFQAVSIQETH